MDKIFLVTGAGNTRPLWTPLSSFAPLGFLYQQSENEARAAGMEAIYSISQLVTPDVQERAINETAKLTARIVNEMESISGKFNAAYPHPAPAALNGKLSEWWLSYAQPRLAGQVMTLTVLEKLAEERDIIGCLVHEDVTPDTRSLIAFCRRRGIPTFHLPHAACHLLPGIDDIHRETRTDYILSSGPYMTRFYTDSGFNPEHIVEIGIPEWDSLRDAIMPDKAEARRVLAIDNPFVVLYGTTWGQTTSLRSRFEQEFAETHEAVLTYCKERGAYLIVNLHPSELPQMEQTYAEMLRANEIEGLVTRQHEMYLVRAADVIIKHGPSNFCIKTAILGRPSCYIQTEGFDFAHSLPPRGAALSLPQLVEAALAVEPESWLDFIRYYDCAYDGDNATALAMKAIEERCRLQSDLKAGVSYAA